MRYSRYEDYLVITISRRGQTAERGLFIASKPPPGGDYRDTMITTEFLTPCNAIIMYIAVLNIMK
jgi:hypothetical protein